MGFTHYWTHKRAFTRAEWNIITQGALDVIARCEARGIKIVREYDRVKEDPLVDRETIVFNGADEEGHETLVITRLQAPKREYGSAPRGWDFTKTARKPYDLAVTAVLAMLDSVYPGKFVVTSDGDIADWAAGVELARLAWPQFDNVITTPRSVLDDARFARYLDSSKHYQLARGHDRKFYLERLSDRWVIELPWTDEDDFDVWIRSVPHNQRRYGSFSGGESEKCDTRRLNALWINFAELAGPPRVFMPLAA